MLNHHFHTFLILSEVEYKYIYMRIFNTLSPVGFAYVVISLYSHLYL